MQLGVEEPQSASQREDCHGCKQYGQQQQSDVAVEQQVEEDARAVSKEKQRCVHSSHVDVYHPPVWILIMMPGQVRCMFGAKVNRAYRISSGPDKAAIRRTIIIELDG
eukprot:scaffold5213_cov37-Prasinocladus_malaysianus.AAC.3